MFHFVIPLVRGVSIVGNALLFAGLSANNRSIKKVCRNSADFSSYKNYQLSIINYPLQDYFTTKMLSLTGLFTSIELKLISPFVLV